MAANDSAGRRHVGMSPTAIVKAGTLEHELRGHALERALHYFYYLITMKLVVAELNAIGGAGTPHRFSKWVAVKATDQIGTGLRSENAAYTPFVANDPEVVKTATTLFTASDAAHFCNLGLRAGLDAACQASPFTRDGYERLKVYAGNTMQLPQKVNIGPDRKIDVLHGQLAAPMLDDDAPILSRARIRVYQAAASLAIQDYIAAKTTKKQFGLAACAECYLHTYAAEFEDRVYLRVYPEVVGLCENSPHFRGLAHKFMS